jgi:nucleoside-diphosphate-sugar epimerase
MTWKGKRVLVTGADGFMGSHLTEALIEAGAEVRAFCFYNSNGSLGWLDRSHLPVRELADVRLGDIRDARFVEASCADVDVVFHLAALIAIP